MAQMATFTEEFTRMRQDFDQAEADRHQLFHDTQEQVKNMAQGVKEQLAEFRQNMRDMHDKIAEMASQVRTGLREMSTDLHTGGNIFRKESSPKMRTRKSH
jgi:gamma-glutamyl:cysteine ligase YbdK (ATP-grasp superfamily)